MDRQPSYLVLVRHCESTKNVEKRFATLDYGSSLTPLGIKQAQLVGAKLALMGFDKHPVDVFTATSARSGETARILAASLSGQAVEVISDLDSIRDDSVAGQKEAIVEEENPEFIRALRLYRAGLLDSHKIPRSGETLLGFESRVRSALDQIIRKSRHNIIVVAQRSPITATLIRYARESLGYPNNYFGYVELGLGAITVLKRSSNGFVPDYVNIAVEDHFRDNLFA